MHPPSEILELYAGSTITYLSTHGTSNAFLPWSYLTVSLTSTTSYVPKGSSVEYINEIGTPVTGGAPSCLNNMSVCPPIENITYSCWNLTTFPGPKECFCQGLEKSSCPGLCNNAGRDSGAADYVQVGAATRSDLLLQFFFQKNLQRTRASQLALLGGLGKLKLSQSLNICTD